MLFKKESTIDKLVKENERLVVERQKVKTNKTKQTLKLKQR